MHEIEKVSSDEQRRQSETWFRYANSVLGLPILKADPPDSASNKGLATETPALTS